MYVVRDLSNAPEYMPGDIVITEPCREPQAGRMMVARGRDSARILGRCEPIGSGFELVPLRAGHERYPSAELVGVVIRHHRNLRNR